MGSNIFREWIVFGGGFSEIDRSAFLHCKFRIVLPSKQRGPSKLEFNFNRFKTSAEHITLFSYTTMIFYDGINYVEKFHEGKISPSLSPIKIRLFAFYAAHQKDHLSFLFL